MGVIKRQGIKNTISGYLGIMIGFVNLIVIQPHFLTKEELGLTRILYSFSILVAMFVPLGIGNATLRYFPMFKDAGKKHHGYFAFMQLFPLIGCSLVFAGLYFCKDFIFDQYRNESPLFVEYFDYVFPLIFFNAFISVLTVFCNAQLKTTIPSYLNDIGVRLMTIVVVTVYFNRWISFDQFVIAFVAIYGIQFLSLIIYIFSFDRPGFRIDWAIFREKRFLELVRYGLLLWFAGIASLGLKYFDSVMIGKYLPLAFVGIYTIAAFIPTVIEAPLVAFEKVASAKIAYAWNENDMEQIRQIYKRSSLYMFLLGGWIFLVVNSNIDALFTFLPEGYSDGKSVILIISFGTLFNMATGLNAPILFNSDRYRYGAFFLVLLAASVLTFQMFLIPRYGLVGAAFATASASVIYNVMLLVSVWRFFGLQPFDARNLRLVLVFSVSFMLSRLLFTVSNPFASIFINTSIVTIVYGGMVWMTGLVPELKEQLMSWKGKSTS